MQPEGPVELVVPFPAGGSLDALARVVSSALAQRLGRPVVVVNVGGASGALAVQRVLQRPADGRTLLLGTLSQLMLGPWADRPSNGPAFEPVAKLSSADYAVVCGPTFPAASLDELVQRARRRPETVSMAHPGEGTLQYLTARRVEQLAGIRLLHVPYSGSAPMMADLSAGQVDAALIMVTAAKPLVESGRIKVLGLLRESAHPTLPAWPYSGSSRSLRGIEAQAWAGLFVAAGVPAVRVDGLRAALADALRSSQVRDALLERGIFPADPDAVDSLRGFPAYVRAELARYQRLKQQASAPVVRS